jgi:hypothetical protein
LKQQQGAVQMSTTGKGIREPGWVLIALCVSNAALWALLTALVLAILANLASLPLEPLAIVALLLAMFLIVFPAGSMIVWKYRAVFRRDQYAAEGIARVLLFFGFFAALIAILLSVGFITAAIAAWGENIAHILVPLAAWAVAAYLLSTGNRYLSWAAELESDLHAASDDEQAEHRSAMRASRLSMRELFLAMTAVCIILGLAVSLHRALFR